MTARDLFSDHLGRIEAWASDALELGRARGEDFDGIVFHSGRVQTYHADDLAVPFRAHAHFSRFAPIPGPDHLLVFRPGHRLRLLRAVASDYWHAAPGPLDAWVLEAMDVEEHASAEVAWSQQRPTGRWAWIGVDAHLAAAIGIAPEDVDPPVVLAALDWMRATKTDFEIECLRQAQRIAGRGHAALRDALVERKTEFELHLDYLAATRQEEIDLPYPSIIAWDESAAVLHYQHRRRTRPEPGRSFLVDAGACALGYASDVTRTYCVAQSGGAAGEFRALLDGMERLQQRIANRVTPGTDFVDLHRDAEQSIGELLCDVGVLNADVDEARERGLVGTFFPHGLGHFLGLQVHDVAGCQAEPTGGTRPPPPDCPHLRTTRTLAAGHVVTVEPGLYFIPSLLERLRAGEDRSAIDWACVDALAPFGGIRIEDDVRVTEVGCENLTRPFVPGHLDVE